jgi:hypothetical protein
MKESLLSDYLDYLNDYLTNFDYSNIDGFAEEHNLSERDIEELLSLPISVTVDDTIYDNLEEDNEDDYDGYDEDDYDDDEYDDEEEDNYGY